MVPAGADTVSFTVNKSLFPDPYAGIFSIAYVRNGELKVLAAKENDVVALN